MRTLRHAFALTLAVATPLAAQSIVGPPKRGEPARIATIPTPEKFFGFQMGADRKMAHWDDMVRYYDLFMRERGAFKNPKRVPDGFSATAPTAVSPAHTART